jgi:hypothetical protein
MSTLAPPAPHAPPSLRAPEIAAALRRTLGQDRLRPYTDQAGGLPGGLRLYRWNAAVAAAMFEVLGTVEIAVRNAVDAALADAVPGGRWWQPAWWPGQRPPRRDLAVAVARASGRRDRHSATVTGLSLAFWTELLSGRHHDDLWLPVLQHAFPGPLPEGSRDGLHQALLRLLALRNRIAHHEPVHGQDLSGLHDTALAVLAAICPLTAEWAARTSRVPALLEQDPRRTA